MARTYVDSLLGDNEKIIMIARQHWFVLLSSITMEIIVILMIIAMAIAIQIVAGIFATPLLVAIAPVSIFVALVLLLVPIISAVHDSLVWWNQQYVLTNWRVMHVRGVYSKNVIDSSLEKVNDIKLEQSALGRMFGFGDIQILTASELGVETFKHLGDPIHFKTAMINAKEEFERGERGDRGQPPQFVAKEDIAGMISRLGELHQQGVLTDEEFQAKKAELLAKM